MFISNNKEIVIEGKTVEILYKTQTEEQVRARQRIVVAVALLSISLVVLGSLVLSLSTTYSTLGAPAIYTLASGGVILLVDIVIISIYKHRSQKEKREADALINQMKCRIGEIIKLTNRDPSIGIASITCLDSKNVEYFFVMEPAICSSSFRIHCLQDLKYRNDLIEQLDNFHEKQPIYHSQPFSYSCRTTGGEKISITLGPFDVENRDIVDITKLNGQNLINSCEKMGEQFIQVRRERLVQVCQQAEKQEVFLTLKDLSSIFHCHENIILKDIEAVRNLASISHQHSSQLGHLYSHLPPI